MSQKPRKASVPNDPEQGGFDVLPGGDIDEKAQKALEERPSLSIRARLTLGFLLFSLFSVAATLMVWYTVHKTERRLHFLELADRYTFEIQQARRFEKNYFLYGTNLVDVIDHVESARDLLLSAREEIASVVGEDNLKSIEVHLRGYKKLLVRLSDLESKLSSEMAPKHPQIEAELRTHGAEMVSVALSLASKERKAVNRTLKFFNRLPIAFLCVLLVLVILAATFLAKQMLGPLSRLMETTQRIAMGSYTPHTPHRRYKDEFTDLAIAINRMAREIFLRQEMLEESHRLRALGTLTAGVAHELNNPLSNISSSCQIIMEEVADRLPEYHRGLLYAIEEQVINARDIVRALLEFSREREFELKPVDLQDVVSDTLKLIKGEIPAGVEIRVDIPEGIVLDLDKAQMERALLNLIMNGIQAMEGGGTLTIQGESRPNVHDAVLEVRDTGMGIPRKDLSRIFEPFFTTKDVGQGTGLGLSVTYGIIERHGGRIEARSEVGTGTTFSVHLPLERPSGERAVGSRTGMI